MDSRSTLVMREANYPPVRYIPLVDVDRSLLTSSNLRTYCPYKGDASYYSIVRDQERGSDAVWFYDQPYPAVAEIKGHVAFYTDRIDLTVSSPIAMRTEQSQQIRPPTKRTETQETDP